MTTAPRVPPLVVLAIAMMFAWFVGRLVDASPAQAHPPKPFSCNWWSEENEQVSPA